MVVKEFLLNSGVDVGKFSNHRKNEPLPRRRLNKTFGGEITTPVPRTSAAIRETLRKKIENGEYRLGEIITPKCYKKLSLNPDGTLKEEYFTVSGRKIPLLEIRKNILDQQEKDGLVRDHSDAHYEAMTNQDLIKRLQELREYKEPSEATREELVESLKYWERTRHLIFWSDHSSIMNHGHILLTVNCIYDPAFYLTSAELNGLDVQELVEKPQIYLLARCRDTIEDQLLYSETRLEDLQQLDIEIFSSHSVPVKDICRMFHGDHPAQEVECGEQNGGHYGCCGCTGTSAAYVDHVASMRAPQVILEERRRKVIAGPAGRERRNGGVNPFQKMTKDDLIRECRGRKIPTDGLKRPALYSQLKEELRGIQRVPALCFPNQKSTMQDLNLTMYEVIPVEPLHDLKEHINNVFKELPKHLTKEEKALFEEAVEAVFSTKEKLRGADYRLCCVVLALHLGNNCRLTIRRLLYTLAELCELLYAPAEKRTPRFILRLHNVTFSHVIAVRSIFQSPQVLTYRKLYGIYYHSITCHAPFTSRLISLSSVDTEEEERQFSTINAISKATSNGHPEHIIPNCIVRAQAEQNFRSKKSCFVDQQSKIGKFATNLPDFPDTVIPQQLLTNEMYQAHLEKIGDFLLCGKGVWWHADEESKEIVFHDGKGQPEFREQGPPMHHFRSSSFQSESLYLKEKWNQCYRKGDVPLPIRKIKVYNPSGSVAYTEWYRIFQDDPWSFDDQENDAQHEDSHQMPDHSEDVQDQPVCTNLMVISNVHEEGAELTDEEFDDGDDDSGDSRNGDSGDVHGCVDDGNGDVHGCVDGGNGDVHVCVDGGNGDVHGCVDGGNGDVHGCVDGGNGDVHGCVDGGNGDVHGCVDGGNGDVHGCVDIGSVVENTEHVINSPDATHLDVEDQDKTDTHDCIHQQVPILQTKLATSVSKVLGVTPLVKTLDKARIALHKEENSRNRYHQDKYKDTLASIQTQVLAAHQKCSKEIEKWEREFVVKNGFAPSFEHFKTKRTIMSQYKRKQLSKELLKHWKITVHKH